jgi:hypothetical protein
VPLAAFAWGLSYSWQRWGEIVIDWGRELEIARRLAAGDMLYADARYWYGPLAPYGNALLFALFGTHTRVLQAAGLCSAVLMTGLLWALGRHLAGAGAAAAVTGAFVSLCAFGHYYVSDTYNWVTPYAYPATYGMVLATASLYALLRSLESSRPAWHTVSLACLALTLLTKLEPAFAAALAHVAFLGTAYRAGDRQVPHLLARYAGILVGVGGVVAAFTLRAGAGEYDANMFSQLNVRNLAPILQYMGVAEWGAGLDLASRSAIRLSACLGVPFVLAPVVATRGPFATGCALAACCAIAIASFLYLPPEQALRGLPLLVLLATADALAHFLRDPSQHVAARADLIMWAFALGALARVPLAAGAHHYGFYLLPVPLAALVLLCFRRLPALRGGGATTTRLFRWTAFALVGTLAYTHTRISAAYYAQHTAHVVTPRGDLWLIDDVGGVPIGRTYAAAVERLREYPPDTTVLAAPEGAGLVFLAGLPTWGHAFSYYPPEVGAEADRRLRRSLETTPPGLLLLTNVLDLRHYGFQGFGRDYATESMTWLQRRYVLDRAFTGDAVVIARPAPSAAPGP